MGENAHTQNPFFEDFDPMFGQERSNLQRYDSPEEKQEAKLSNSESSESLISNELKDVPSAENKFSRINQWLKDIEINFATLIIGGLDTTARKDILENIEKGEKLSH